MARKPKTEEAQDPAQQDGDAAGAVAGTVEDAPNGIAPGEQVPGAVDGDGNPIPPAVVDVTVQIDEAVEPALKEAGELAAQQAARIAELEDQVAEKDAQIAELETAAAEMAAALEAAGVEAPAAGPQPGDVIDNVHITAISGNTIEIVVGNETKILQLGLKPSAVAPFRNGPARLILGRDEEGAVVVTTIERAE